MEVHLLDVHDHGGWCPTCRALTFTIREYVTVDPATLLIVERGRTLVCESCDIAVLV